MGNEGREVRGGKKKEGGEWGKVGWRGQERRGEGASNMGGATKEREYRGSPQEDVDAQKEVSPPLPHPALFCVV